MPDVRESVVGLKQIPDSSWAVALTSPSNYEFFYNVETKASVWAVPSELLDLLLKLQEEGKRKREEDETASIKEESATVPPPETVSENGSTTVNGLKRPAPDGAAGVLPAPKRSRRTQEEEEDEEAEAAMAEEDKKRRSNLTHDQRVEEFKQLMREKNVNPFGMWASEVHKIAKDPRYSFVPLREKQEIFDVFCRVRAAELAEEKKRQRETVAAGNNTPAGATSNGSKLLHPVDEKRLITYKGLLEKEVTLKSRWADFSRKWRFDTRFRAVPEMRDRETLFDEHLLKMKEGKGKEKSDFQALLAEQEDIKATTSWREIKIVIQNDPRYKAIVSASEREEMFRDYAKNLKGKDDEERLQKEEEKRKAERKAREEAALRDRQEQLQRESISQRRDMVGSRNMLQRDEAVRLFKTLLIDFVRSHRAVYTESMQKLEKDSRWAQLSFAALPQGLRQELFGRHLDEIFNKRLRSFHGLVDSSSRLDATFDEVYPLVKDQPAVTVLGLSEEELRPLFQEHMEERSRKGRRDFMEMVQENTFVQFHVKQAVLNAEAAINMELEAKGTAGALGDVKTGEVESAKVDERRVWEGIDAAEIRQVLKEDSRYLAFDHNPKERDSMLLQHIRTVISDTIAEKSGTKDLTIALHAGGKVVPGRKELRKMDSGAKDGSAVKETRSMTPSRPAGRPSEAETGRDRGEERDYDARSREGASRDAGRPLDRRGDRRDDVGDYPRSPPQVRSDSRGDHYSHRRNRSRPHDKRDRSRCRDRKRDYSRERRR
ncbi:hypothetical protein M427DRAFT_53334 [Gonapodya prolifera JEL478]|uniref:WW domain-containing protein n=1 Tax=Gonapodya prolifera (strain JEL478) TaxID=1344416 RepID=A0A139AQ24_GONPJ|nr:hypothetical protein M427DRAFT_53334 [Gonapodya prolifera JEL478]|eukprot:KXS18849.1 hypothetical protein M427DRAFT_53334 [Gonapodya prolifera JEL478]